MAGVTLGSTKTTPKTKKISRTNAAHLRERPLYHRTMTRAIVAGLFKERLYLDGGPVDAPVAALASTICCSWQGWLLA